MAGLNCGEPFLITWPILRDYAGYYFAYPDNVPAHGMKVHAAPRRGDQPVVSGESGAVTAGLVSLLTTDERMKPFREKLGLGGNSVILLFNTEGDMDPEDYRNIAI